jgi:DNA-binding PadR family transcriptional regulator
MRPVIGMRESDRPILKALADTGFALKPKVLKYNLETRYGVSVHQQTIYRRLKALRHAGLIKKEDESAGYYAIAELGQRLLDEELSDDEVAEVTQRLQEGPPDDS